jgi:hypothetical protein
MGERVANEVHPATLPAGVHYLGDSRLYALVSVGGGEGSREQRRIDAVHEQAEPASAGNAVLIVK